MVISTEEMIRQMMDSALIAAGAIKVLERHGYPDKYNSYQGEYNMIALIKGLEAGKGKDVEVELSKLRQRAAALCFLDCYGYSGYGMRKDTFKVKGKKWREIIQEAGHRLWRQTGQNLGPVFGPILFVQDGPMNTGLFIGCVRDPKKGIGGVMVLPIKTAYEQNHLAKEGLKKSLGEYAKHPEMLADNPAEQWQEVIDRTERILRKQRGTAIKRPSFSKSGSTGSRAARLLRDA